MLLRRNEVIRKYGVSNNSLLQWEKDDKLKTYRTPGGHRRYMEDEIKALLGLDSMDDGSFILLRKKQVVEKYRLTYETIRRLQKEGKLNIHRTPGGHGRYLESEVQAALGINMDEHYKRLEQIKKRIKDE